MRGPLLLRVDSTLRMGTGHVMRCIALAQAAQAAGAGCTFASASLLPELGSRIMEEGFATRHIATEPGSPGDARELVELAERLDASWVVVDGYHFFEDYQRTLKDAGLRVLLIDDYGHASHYCADLVVNPNPYANRSSYQVDDDSTGFLLGTRYALLRREFWDGAGERTHPEIARHLLVTLGGSDPDNVTATIVREARMVSSDLAEVVVVIGRSSSYYESVAKEAATMSGRACVIRDPPDMAKLMRRADIAVSAAGGTALELAAMGVPALVVPIAENQLSVARSLHEKRAAISLGSGSALSAGAVAAAIETLMSNRDERVELSSNGRALVDGRGAHRIVEAMEAGRDVSAPITIRGANHGDARLLWEWANDPAVRAVSFISGSIRWDDHLRWLSRKLNDASCHLYIGVNCHSVPVGQIRFDMDADCATLSVSLDAKFRGQGYSTALIRIATRELFRTTSVESIHAFVKPLNNSSLRMFRKAGFTEKGQQSVHGQTAVRFVLGRSA